jgi:amidophosphoribosyltransferase
MSEFNFPLHEECGVFGIYDKAGTEDVTAAVYSALYALQHRGQESCGIAVNDDGVIQGHRDLGLVNEVFTPQALAALSSPTARMATGHVRYATAGSRIVANAQPIVVRHRRGTMALCHNGNLTNAIALRNELENEGAIFHGSSDTEVISYLVTRNRLKTGSIEAAISATMDVLEGAYSLVIMSSTKLIAVRDPRGFRPLCIGTLPGGGYAFASESCALDAAGADFLRDVEPGEIVVADAHGLRSMKDHCGSKKSSMCVFEFIYFARPDSIVEGSSVHEARKQAGRFLAQEHPVDADVVIGVPDSGLDAALGYSQESGIPYSIGFVKNKYIGRTFIQGSQKQRENSVRIKLNVVSSTVRGKRVVLIDDSIVRGTTSARIIKLLRDAGAKEVHFRVSAPPFKYPCYFGTDIPDQKLLVATGRTVEQINQVLGADSLGYLSVEHVQQLAQNSHCGFCTACFTGEYAVKPDEVLSTDIHERPLSERKLGKAEQLSFD